MPTLPRLAYLVASIVIALVSVVLVVRWKRAGRAGWGALVFVVMGVTPLVYQGLVYAQLVRETYIRFTHPLATLLPAAMTLLLLWRLSLLPARMTRARRALVWFFTTLAALAAALAVAEPELGKPLDRMTILLLIDRSRSIDLVPGADARIASELRVAEKGMRDDDRIGTVVFAADAITEDPPRPHSDLPPPQRVELGRDGTNVEAAIRRALAELPSDSAPRIVLVTDGVQTRGDALAAAAAAVAADVPIDVVPLDQKTFPDVRIVSVRAPSYANEGEPLDL
ncbi:MAG TPA: vWA domain-containing protein, partial [Polyangiaceae bacterium]